MKGAIIEADELEVGGCGGGQLFEEELQESTSERGQLQKEALACRWFPGPIQIKVTAGRSWGVRPFLEKSTLGINQGKLRVICAHFCMKTRKKRPIEIAYPHEILALPVRIRLYFFLPAGFVPNLTPKSPFPGT